MNVRHAAAIPEQSLAFVDNLNTGVIVKTNTQCSQKRQFKGFSIDACSSVAFKRCCGAI